MMIDEEVVAAIKALLAVIPDDSSDYADAPMHRQVQDRIKPIQNWLDWLKTDTSLVWENLTDDGSIHDKYNLYNWTDAIAVKIAALNSAVYAGYSDWRVPTIEELLAIAPFDRDGFQPSFYWSSSPYAGIPTGAWAVDFNDGYTFATNRATSHYVRAVRGGYY